MADAKGFDRLPKTIEGIKRFTASKGILWFLMGALLYVGHSAFIPIALALLAALILSGPVEALHRLKVSRAVSALVILIATLGVAAVLIAILWNPAQDWYAAAPKTLAAIQKKITPLAKVVQHIEQLSQRASSVAAPAISSTATPAAGPSLPALVMSAASDMLAGLAALIITTLFLLVGGPPMVARMTSAFFDHLKANHVLNYIEKVRGEVGHYYLVTTIINLGLGIATTGVMWAWGMPTPYLWGATAALLNYFPYIGAATTLFLITLVALVSFDGLGRAMGIGLSYVGLATLEGQLIQPLLVGRRLEVNPLLIFLGLWLGGFFWGIAGIVLATPTLVALKVIAENSLHGESMMQFLGPNVELALAKTAPRRPSITTNK